MNICERVRILKAMDDLVRSCNNESYIIHWLTMGVADGDAIDNERLENYTDDETFSKCMRVFLDCMYMAIEDGGLYVDGVVSE